MIRTLLSIAALLGLGLGLVCADPMKGKITKVDGDKILFAEGKKGEIKTYDVTKDVKVLKMEKKTKLEIPGGLKSDDLQNIDGKKGLAATIEVVDGKVTEIVLGKRKKN